jgi:hypothetical protein
MHAPALLSPQHFISLASDTHSPSCGRKGDTVIADRHDTQPRQHAISLIVIIMYLRRIGLHASFLSEGLRNSRRRDRSALSSRELMNWEAGCCRWLGTFFLVLPNKATAAGL